LREIQLPDLESLAVGEDGKETVEVSVQADLLQDLPPEEADATADVVEPVL
jgi:hypothetical protein